ncbi:MAG: TrkA C-terminal domain-containing protein [Sciscionella sp.]
MTILRDGLVYPPDPDQPVESGDELLFVASAGSEEEIQRLLAPEGHPID